MSGSSVLNVTIQGDQITAELALGEIEGIDEIVECTETDENTWLYKIRLKDEKVRQQITSALVENKVNIIEMSMEKADLEQIFLELTGKKSKRSSSADN